MVMIGVASSSLIWRVFVVTIRSYRETQIKDMVNFDIWMHMEKNKQSSTDKARPIFLIIKLLGLALPLEYVNFTDPSKPPLKFLLGSIKVQPSRKNLKKMLVNGFRLVLKFF